MPAGAQCGAAHGAHARTWAAIESAAVELRDQTRVAEAGYTGRASKAGSGPNKQAAAVGRIP